MSTPHSTSQELTRQIDAHMRRLRGAVSDYSTKDRKRIVRSAASKIAVAARRNPGFSDSAKPHFRGTGANQVQYNPGNLRRSLGVVAGLRRSPDAFVGPRFARKRAKVYGGVGQPTDGYYAAMLYGSAKAFARRVLEPGLRRGRSAALKIITLKTDKAIAARSRRRGITVR